MFSKNQIDALFGFKDKDLAHMANEVGDCVEAKKDIFIDFGEGAEEIDDVLSDSHRVMEREYPGIGQTSDKPWVVKQKAPIKKGYFGREFLKEVGLELKKFGSQAKIRIGDDTYHFVSATVNQTADQMTAYVSSNLGTTDHFIFPMSMQWNFDKKFGAWVPDLFEDVIYLTLDIILELNKNRNATHYVSGVQMKYMDSARVPIINGAIFRFSDKHGNVKVFHSTPETKLRVLKLGDETQLHLEHARKMKFD